MGNNFIEEISCIYQNDDHYYYEQCHHRRGRHSHDEDHVGVAHRDQAKTFFKQKYLFFIYGK